MKDHLELKQAVHAACLSLLDARIRDAQAGLEQAREAGRADTKSSAGDKHETSRAMAQIELEKQSIALQYLQEMEAAFLHLQPSLHVSQITPGALVGTDKATFYVSAAMGKMIVDATTVVAISMQAPILSALRGLTIGETGTCNGQAYRLLWIA